MKEIEENSIKEYGIAYYENHLYNHRICMISIVGEIEGHEINQSITKTTKYEHLLPILASIEDDSKTDGLLILLNTAGGDVEAGLSIAEIIASISKPTVSLVLGGSHSIGVPLAVSTDYSMIVPSGNMIIHPVRMNGLMIGTSQTYNYLEQIQDRILSFITKHSTVRYDRLKALMHDRSHMARDVGTVLESDESVKEGIINQIGGISDAFKKLHEMIFISKNESREHM